MWREEYFIEGFRFIGTAEFRELEARGGKKPHEVLSEEEFMNYYLYKMRQERCELNWSSDIRTDAEVQSLGTILIILVELERRINVILDRPQKTIKESIVNGRIEEVELITPEQFFTLGKLIHPKKIDIQSQLLYLKLQEDNWFEKWTIISGNTRLYNIRPEKEKLGFLLSYRKELDSRVKMIRASKEYKWFLQEDGLIAGTWRSF